MSVYTRTQNKLAVVDDIVEVKINTQIAAHKFCPIYCSACMSKTLYNNL